jgi:hypothetical protein
LEAFPLNELQAIESLGFTLPTPAYLVGMILFSVVGLAALRYGRKASHPVAKWIGIALMLYPYAVSATWLLYAIGAGLCAALYWFRE